MNFIAQVCITNLLQTGLILLLVEEILRPYYSLIATDI